MIGGGGPVCDAQSVQHKFTKKASSYHSCLERATQFGTGVKRWKCLWRALQLGKGEKDAKRLWHVLIRRNWQVAFVK